MIKQEISLEERWEIRLHQIRVSACECKHPLPSQELLQFIHDELALQQKQSLAALRNKIEKIKYSNIGTTKLYTQYNQAIDDVLSLLQDKEGKGSDVPRKEGEERGIDIEKED